MSAPVVRPPIPPTLDRWGRATPKRPAGARLGALLRQCYGCGYWHEILPSRVVEVRCCCAVDAAGQGIPVWRERVPHRPYNQNLVPTT